MNLRTVEIVGGGLAGLSLGIGLRARGIPVRIVEAGDYPRHRVCGEFITGLSDKTRRELRLDRILSGARQASHVSWFEPGRARLRHALPQPALCLSRFRLDALLAEDFRNSGGELVTGHRTDREARPGRVLACGRRPHTDSGWIGRKQHFRQLQTTDDLEVHLGRGSYVGVTTVEDGVTNVCGLFPRPGPRSDASLVSLVRGAGLNDLAARIEKAEPVEASGCAVAGLDYALSDAPGVSIGDHLGLIPPFTGHGMTLAVEGAVVCLPHLDDWSRGNKTWEKTGADIAGDLRRCLGRRIKWARVLHPWLLCPRRRSFVHFLHALRLLPVGAFYRLCH